MNKSYLAMVEYPNETIHKFFTGKLLKGETRAMKPLTEANEWASAIIREKGTSNVRVTVSEVISAITG